MSSSHSAEEWDEMFEYWIDLTMGLMALELGRQYLCRNNRMPMHTSVRTRHQYMLELINEHPDILFNKIRMYRKCFEMLVHVLKQETGLQNNKYLTLEEQVMIFLYVISQKATNRMAMEDWQHSGSTISIVFTWICKAIATLSSTFIRAPNFDRVLDKIRLNPKYFPYFQDCVGAIDGSHIVAWAPAAVANHFQGRKHNIMQNIMVARSFDMLFTYMVTGWEGAVHDARVLTTVLEDPISGFPYPPPGKYYLVDSGYSNKPGYLAPFRNRSYHLRDTRRRVGRFNCLLDLFNYRHASLRNCIEYCFGVLKARFPILRYMTNFPLIRQREIVMCYCVLHNFIKLHNRGGPMFDRCGVDGVMPDADSNEEDDAPSSSSNTHNQGGYGGNDDNLVNKIRDHIMFQMYMDYN